jgi:hypothetical protein
MHRLLTSATGTNVGASRGLFTRAAGLLPEGDESRLEILRELQWPRSEAGAFDDMRAAIGKAEAARDSAFHRFADAVRLWIPFSAGGYDEERARGRSTSSARVMNPIGDHLGFAWLEILTFAVSWSAVLRRGRA